MRLAVPFLAILPCVARAQDLFVTHQGRLLDALGAPIQGSHDLRVSLYDAQDGGTDVWRRVYRGVSIQDGYFSVGLTGPDDSGRPLDDALGVTAPRYVAIGLNSPLADLGPRSRIGTQVGNASPTSTSAFTSLPQVDGSTWYLSDPITLGGTQRQLLVLQSEATAGITINGVHLDVKGYFGQPGDTVRIAMKSSPLFGEVVAAVLYVDGVPHPWGLKTHFVCQESEQIFTYTGGPQTFTMPRACSTMTVRAWAGGGGAGSGYPGFGFGGAGGYVDTTFEVAPGDEFAVIVGGGGATETASFRGGGGGGGSFLIRDEWSYVAVGGGGGGSGHLNPGGAGGVVPEGGSLGGNRGGGGAVGTVGGHGGYAGGQAGAHASSSVVAAGGNGYNGLGGYGGYGGGGRGGSTLNCGGGGGGGMAGGGGGGIFDGDCGGGGGGSSGVIGFMPVQLHAPASAGVNPPAESLTMYGYEPGVAMGGRGSAGGPGLIVISWFE
jgi:hypothetical protein